ncbi:MAG TPA: helix-turn-helix domain-containing protein [Pseudomonadota bacterium]|nr:helix-turn-helix domain-containing protein [Pseudomonadota bacterium]
MANGDIGAPAFGIGAQKETSAGGSFPLHSWVSELVRLSRRQRTERRLVERARMVLSTLDGSIYTASRRLGCSKSTLRKWRDRVALARQHHPDRPIEQKLRDAERSGRPPEFSEAQLVALMSLATADPQTEGESTSHWRVTPWRVLPSSEDIFRTFPRVM